MEYKKSFRRSWNSQIEYPVRLSPFFKDPKELPPGFARNSTQKLTPQKMIQYINDCRIQNESEETRLDLVSSSDERVDHPQKQVRFTLCIECKKLDPDYATWIFFKTSNETSMNLISKNKKNEDNVTLLEIPETTRKNIKTYIQLMQSWNFKPIRHSLCDSSVAINKKEKERGKRNKEFYKRDFDKIDDAARQIIKGTYGYILDKLNHQIVSANEEDDCNNIIYFPIIVTTAELKIGVFDEDKIDRDDGFLTEPLELEKVDSLIYEVAPPSSVRFSSPDFDSLDLERKRSSSKWHVLIMSVDGFMKFLKDLDASRDLFLSK